jgi:hypothetical protein
MVGAAIPLCGASQAFRTFTDLEGRTIEAEILEADKTEVRIRRDDGRVFDLNRSRLIEADQQYIDDWIRKRAFAFGDLEVSTWRVRKGAERSETQSTKNIEEEWCYKVSIANKSRADFNNLSVEYRVFFREDIIRKSNEQPPLQSDAGRISIGHLAARDEVQLVTNAIVLDVSQLKIGWKYRGTGKRRVEDSLEGIWLRIFSDGELVKEYPSPTDLPRRQSW